MNLKEFRKLTKDLPETTEILAPTYSRDFQSSKATINTAIHYSYCDVYDGDGDLERILKIDKGAKRVKVVIVHG